MWCVMPCRGHGSDSYRVCVCICGRMRSAHSVHMEDSAPAAPRPSMVVLETWRHMVSVWKRHLPVLHGITHSALSLPSSLGEYVLAGPGPLLPAGHCPGLPYVIPDYSVRDSANGSLGSDMTAADVRSTELICMLAAREGEGSEGET